MSKKRKPARHLRVGSGVACGLRDARRTSSDPRDVTCSLCAGTVHMADAEFSLWISKGFSN